LPASPNDLLLHSGDPRDVDLNAEVPARHHDGVGLVDDLVQGLDRLGPLDLCHDPGAGVEAPEFVTQLAHVLRAADEAEPEEIDGMPGRPAYVVIVLLGERSTRQLDAWHIDAGARANLTGLNDTADDGAFLLLFDPHRDQAVDQ